MNLFVDLRPFKADMHALINSVDVAKSDWAEKLRADILASAARHGASLNSKASEFAAKIVMLVQANNRARAGKLVDALADRDITESGLIRIKAVTVVVKLVLLTLFVLLVVFIYHRCLGA